MNGSPQLTIPVASSGTQPINVATTTTARLFVQKNTERAGRRKPSSLLPEECLSFTFKSSFAIRLPAVLRTMSNQGVEYQPR